jgi:hypothetical protein
MVTQMVKETYEKPAGSACIHHWIIETPDGPVSRGVCKHCKAEKYFDNVLQDKYSSESTPRAVVRTGPAGKKDDPEEEWIEDADEDWQ